MPAQWWSPLSAWQIDDRVVARGVEAAVGFVAQGEAGQRLAALEGERLRVDKIMRLDEADLAGLGGRAGNVLLRVVHEQAVLTTDAAEETQMRKAKIHVTWIGGRRDW